MGMFDEVIGVPASLSKCPSCDEKLDYWQSKDGKCLCNEIHFQKVDNFYTSCEECGTWVEFTRGKRKFFGLLRGRFKGYYENKDNHSRR